MTSCQRCFQAICGSSCRRFPLHILASPHQYQLCHSREKRGLGSWYMPLATAPRKWLCSKLATGSTACCLSAAVSLCRRASGSACSLVGGGVGTAPLPLFGQMFEKRRASSNLPLGGRSAADILQVELFEAYGPVYHHRTRLRGARRVLWGPIIPFCLQSVFDAIAPCGPKPMMKAVAAFAAANNVNCEVSLENMMACGLGACLCCVEKTKRGTMFACAKKDQCST